MTKDQVYYDDKGPTEVCVVWWWFHRYWYLIVVIGTAWKVWRMSLSQNTAEALGGD